MKARIAKKVLRANFEEPKARHRFSTYRAAFRKRNQLWTRIQQQHRDGLWHGTKGWRWGKWDPARPMAPWEIPF